MGLGEFEGLPIRGPEAAVETKAKFKQFGDLMLKDVNLAWPGDGVTTADVSTRSQAALARILKDYTQERHIAIVAHRRVNKVLLAKLLYGDASMYGNVQQGNTCINVVDVSSSGEWRQQQINYLDHLQSQEIVNKSPS